MKDMTKDGRSIEELTIKSLDESVSGLEALSRNSVLCGELLLTDTGNGLVRFDALAGNIRNFYVFENDIRSLFQVDSESILDAGGNLRKAEDALTSVMQDMIARLDARDVTGLAEILMTGLPVVMKRFVTLLPLLRQRIQHDYLPSTC